MKRPFSSIFLILLLTFAVSISCKKSLKESHNSKIVEIPALNLSLNYEGWHYGDNPELIHQAEELAAEGDQSGTIKKALEVAGINFFLFEHPVGSPEAFPFNTNVNYAVEDLSRQPRNITLDQYISAVTGYYPTVFQKYEMIQQPKKTKIHGMESALLESRFEQTFGERNLKLHNYQLVFILNKKAHIFTGTFLEKDLGSKGSKILDLFSKFEKL
ncbi:hypothetical protein EHQ12_12620 [Leptospira gomenensis]|uniref:DUF1795 domain-containing protein n=1 Tax=Leptospira gomenensis TaxID=2484974 RepID=A0A5F1YQM1_9LEPT|nr:hypothetical protein [Leptospira gomenensis]TGK32773.1 hypothetical protein EHQ17_12465 [Leptospira gomenensis]TGK36921.1 hypothetical protein EHQ12_12620 [Leptospira gomenensis]TGK44392.1 hypothetical protein EHQ07_11935 [Leptospira gomenensis]TGK58885.1 hypothetical protein EHQ13_13755 [Leptospira gomenensis]